MADTEFAKTHLRDHLRSLLVPPVCDGFWSIQSSAKELCERNGIPDQVIRTFQNMLTKIPEWSEQTLSTEVQRIQKVSKCTYLEDLMMGVFLAYMKAFASLHSTESSVEIEFERPTLAKFVHEYYIQSARKLWQAAYLFKTNVSAEVQARSRHEIESLLHQSLESVIHHFLPWESIARKYFVGTKSEPEPEPEKSVTFGETEEKEIEDDEEDRPVLTLSDELATLELEEEDPLKELETKADETLVLNL